MTHTWIRAPLLLLAALVVAVGILLLVLARPTDPKAAAVASGPPAIGSAEPTPVPTIPWTPSPLAVARDPLATEVTEPTQQHLATGCREQFGVGDSQSIDDTAYYAQSVFVGRVTAIHEARWSTEDGQSPRDEPFAGAPAFIYTPLTIEVELPIREANAGDVVETRVGGGTVGNGTVGCTHFLLSGVPTDFAIDQRFAIFLIDPELVPETYRLVGIWPAVNNLVMTPMDGELTVEELTERVATAGYNPFPSAP